MNTQPHEIKRVLDWIRKDAAMRGFSRVSILRPLAPAESSRALQQRSNPAPSDLVTFYSLCDGIWFEDLHIKGVQELSEEAGLGWVSIRDWGEGSVDCLRTDEGPMCGTVWMSTHDPEKRAIIAPSLATYLAMLYMEYVDRGAIGNERGKGVYRDAP